LIEQNGQPEQPDLRAALFAAWPALERWQARLTSNHRIRKARQKIGSRSFQRSFHTIIIIAFVTFVGLAVYRYWSELQQYDWRADLRYVLLAVAVFPLAYLPTAWCWHWLVRRISSFTNGRVNSHIYFMSSLGRYIPGGIWYIAGRAYWYKDYQVPTSHVIIGTIWENLIFATSGLIVYAFLGWQQILVACLILAATPLLYSAILNRLVTLAYQKLGQDPPQSVPPSDVLSMLGILCIAWSAAGLMLWWVANAVHPLEQGVLPTLTGFWGLASAVSVFAAYLLGGLGLRELTLGVLLSQVLPVPVAAVIALAFRLVMTVSEAIWALVFSGLTRSKTH